MLWVVIGQVGSESFGLARVMATNPISLWGWSFGRENRIATRFDSEIGDTGGTVDADAL